MRQFNIGIALTLSRLAILPVAIAGIAAGSRWIPPAAMVAAVMTDLADGGLARILGQYSQFNKDLDSTVDFVLIHAMFIALYVAGRIETWQFAVIYAAMLATFSLQVFGGSGLGGGVVRTRFGRPTGALEYLYLLFVVGRGAVTNRPLFAVVDSVLFAVLAASAAIYALECVSLLRRRSKEVGPGED